MNRQQIGLQMYTVREHTQTDMRGTLRQLSDIGYRAVELAGYGSLSVTELRRALDEYGLRALGAHVPFARFANDIGGVIADLQSLGCTYAIVPFLAPEQRATRDDVERLAHSFNEWSSQCSAAGLRFAYHNHAFEFEPLEGSTMFEILASATDPASVAFELDLFWVRVGGLDPLATLQRYAGRVPLVHVKDLAEGDTPKDVPVGEGVMPWSELLAACETAGVEWYIVEQDHPRDALPDVATSLRYLEQNFAPR